MIKYPSVLSLNEFKKLVDKYKVLDLVEEVYIQPKYDGSNITCFHRSCLTRNHNPLPNTFVEGFRRALGDKYESLMRLSEKYQVFLELGGFANSPAGYSKPWGGEWDYVVFDLYAGRFLKPTRVESIVTSMGLKYVGHEATNLSVFDSPQELLGRFADYEGYVVKLYLSEPLKLYSARYGMIAVKVKHDSAPVTLAKQKKKGRERVESRSVVELPESEILGAINKAHLTLGSSIANRKKAMPVIFKLVREEAEKHGYKVPSPNKVFRLYQKYLDRVRAQELV